MGERRGNPGDTSELFVTHSSFSDFFFTASPCAVGGPGLSGLSVSVSSKACVVPD